MQIGNFYSRWMYFTHSRESPRCPRSRRGRKLKRKYIKKAMCVGQIAKVARVKNFQIFSDNTEDLGTYILHFVHTCFSTLSHKFPVSLFSKSSCFILCGNRGRKSFFSKEVSSSSNSIFAPFHFTYTLFIYYTSNAFALLSPLRPQHHPQKLVGISFHWPSVKNFFAIMAAKTLTYRLGLIFRSPQKHSILPYK